MVLVAYSIEDCIEACAEFNYNQGQNLGQNPCKSAVFHSVMRYPGLPNGPNCWLKGSDAVTTQPFSGAAAMRQYSAVAYLNTI
jgi:hypothetical protein